MARPAFPAILNSLVANSGIGSEKRADSLRTGSADTPLPPNNPFEDGISEAEKQARAPRYRFSGIEN